jgi:hypothetical protein
MYMLEVPALAYLSFYNFWGNVGRWLRGWLKHQWSSKDMVVSKIVNQACKVKHLQMFKQDGMEIIPVESKEEADCLS